MRDPGRSLLRVLVAVGCSAARDECWPPNAMQLVEVTRHLPLRAWPCCARSRPSTRR